MEQFFKPVHGAFPLDEMKPQKKHHHHHFDHQQSTHSNRYTKLDDTDRNTDDSQGHRRLHQQNQYLSDGSHHGAHYPHQFHQGEDDGKLYNNHTPITLSRASSSSLSSTSSSSSSWFTEESASDAFSLRHAERPPHSLSCSNIPDVRRVFREDDGSGPVVFASVKHNKKGNVDRIHDGSQLSRKSEFSALKRGHSRSDEALLQCIEARNHQGSPPPGQYSHSTGHSRKERRPSPIGGTMLGDRYGRYGSHLTDGTSTSPEPSQPKQRHHRKHNQHPHSQHFPQQMHLEPEIQGPSNSPPASVQGAGTGFGSESSSTKSDSSRTRETPSTSASHSSEQSGRQHSQYMGVSKQHRDILYDAGHLQALQEENADLHQNLLQTVVCIESLEAELHRTREELSHVKEKYKSLLQTHSGTKQANNLLGEHLHIASESLSSERKYLIDRVSQLNSELEDANRTIAALENINVPCLIKELLGKQFDSAEAVQKFLTTSSATSHFQQTDGQSHSPNAEEVAHDWLTKSEAGAQRATAFMPFKQGLPANKNEASLSGQHESSPPFSVADISAAIYKKMAASYAARPQPVYPESQQQLSLGTNHADTPPDPQHAHVGGSSWGGRDGLKVLLLEQDTGDVNAMSAQQILDDFMQHLQTHKEAVGGKEQQSGQEWGSGVEQAGKAD
ncbi:uncharacterized protein si:ch211-276i12.4 isoform X4 [Cololabis saira]|uniref:uncharacterized protein si:ch211-276i12.4 isoform X4 n=1 Tax=Cololabis saira TaxID=129043 RepID=UPI002AD423C5|nr:uncharacterized protein si:ch211-276i12.4 isoform X4 [Cololabis saira]